MASFKTVDEYINSQPDKQRLILEKIRKLVRQEVPGAEETLGYGVASFKLNGKPLIYYASFKNHVGIYPVPHTEGKLADQIKRYQTGKGTMQFPLDKPILYDFIQKIVRVRQNEIEKNN